MPRATCRCGQKLSIPINGPERVICPKCQSRIRVRKDSPGASAVGGEEGYIRFDCPCGRRLKVRRTPGEDLPLAGKCPDCGRVVPVPSRSTSTSTSEGGDVESITEEMNDDDLAVLDRWAQRYEAQRTPRVAAPSAMAVEAARSQSRPEFTPEPPEPVATRVEAGLRVCPRCGRPVHLSAVACRECGAPVPKR